MIPTVELSQRGGAVTRARGRPKGVKEAKPRRKTHRMPDGTLMTGATHNAESRALRQAEDDAIRKRRRGFQVDDPRDDDGEDFLTLGPRQKLTRYELPKKKVVVPPSPAMLPVKAKPKKAPLLSATTKQRLKKGVLAAIVAGTLYIFRQQIKEQGGALAKAALLYIDKLIGEFEVGYSGTDVQSALQRVNNDGIAIPDSLPSTPPPANIPGYFGPFQVIDDEEPFTSPSLRSSPSRSSLTPDQLKKVKRRVKDFQKEQRRSSRSTRGQRVVYNADGRGLGSPCAHMKQAGRIIFDLAESGDKKTAKKEVKQLSQHLKEIKKYVASL